MAHFQDKWDLKMLPGHQAGETRSRCSGKVNVKRFFEAALSLELDELEYVLSSGTVNVNEHYFIDRSSSAQPVDHTKQTFGSQQIKGKVICNIFANIDDGSLLRNIFLVLQVYLVFFKV